MESVGGSRRKLGYALGSGSARGWAHIGVVTALRERGAEPDVVAGASIGALVGAFVAAGELDALDEWVRGIRRADVLEMMDVTLMARGGLVRGEKVVEFLRSKLGEPDIEDLEIPFAAVATDLRTGHEVWFTEGPLIPAVRASISLPGFFTPTTYRDRVLVDGGLINPVPVSLCHALGAERVVAVNLNGDLLSGAYESEAGDKVPDRSEAGRPTWFEKLSEQVREATASFFPEDDDRRAEAQYSLFEVLARCIDIMQDRITRSRIAGDPPDVALSPRLGELSLLDFEHGESAINEGREAVERALPELSRALGVDLTQRTDE